MRELIPIIPVKRQSDTRKLQPLSIETKDPIELIKLLSIEHRQLIESGVAEGSRNTTAHGIARDAIGAEQWATSEGLVLDCTAWDLVHDFGSRCSPPSPPLDVRKIQHLFTSALKANPNPCLSEDKLWNCVSAQLPRQPPPPSRSTPAPQPNSSSVDPPSLTLKQQLELLAEKSLDPASCQAALFDLSKLYGCRVIDAEKLLASIESTRDYYDDLEKTAASFDQLLQLEARRLDLQRVLPSKLANAILATAASMPTTPAALFTTFIPTAASRIGSSSRIIVKASSNYIEPCIFRTTLVANTGDRKTPTQKAIIDPLYALETKAYERWRCEQESYEQALEEHEPGQPKPKAPDSRQRYIINDATTEAKIRIHSENPRGLLDYTDELAGRFTRMNKYRGGHGDDMQQDLSEFNGGAISKDRTRESIYLPRSAISSTGSIQWETLKQLQEKSGRDDHAGVWARWLFCVEPMPAPFLNLTGPDADLDTGLGDLLEVLYYRLGELPKQDYLLSQAAKVKFERWQHKLVLKHQTESLPVLKAAYPKMEAYAVRMALLLHLVWAVMEGRIPEPSISEETMGRALHVVNYYLSQLRLLISYNGLDPLTQLEGSLLKIKAMLDQKETISARDLQRGSLRQLQAQQIKDLMALLAERGFGYLEGSGSRLRLTKSVATVAELIHETVTVAQRADPPPPEASRTNGYQSVAEVSQGDVTVSPSSRSSQSVGFELSGYESVAVSQAHNNNPATLATVSPLEPESQSIQDLQPEKSVTTECDSHCDSCDTLDSAAHSSHEPSQISPRARASPYVTNGCDNSCDSCDSLTPKANPPPWIPAIGSKVKFRPGMCCVPTWTELELTVVNILDPIQGLVEIKGNQWVVTQQVNTSVLRPIRGNHHV